MKRPGLTRKMSENRRAYYIGGLLPGQGRLAYRRASYIEDYAIIETMAINALADK